MQGIISSLRKKLWDNLRDVFDKFPTRGDQMEINTVEDFFKTALGEQTQQEIDYVMKNIFRLDTDKSGSVSFREMVHILQQKGNFLFQRHCAEMSLQEMHKNGKMSRGTERKMTLQEFQILCNKAWKFLKVGIPSDAARQIFNEADTDRDGLITYVEYFQFIQKSICQTKAQFEGKVEVAKPIETIKPVNEGPERLSRLRKWIWDSLFRLYRAYISGRLLPVSDKELRGLTVAILGDLSDLEILFLLNGLLKLACKNIQFEPFAMIFIYLVAELGLSRFSKNHPVTKKTLSKDQFVILFRNSFKPFEVSRIRKEFLWKVFAKIDKNSDGLITYDEYLDWVKRFLAVLKYFGDEFWVYPDDDFHSMIDNFELTQKPFAQVAKPVDKIRVTKFNFSNYDFAIQVRKRMLDVLSTYDRNRDKLFDQKQITDALINVLKENENELYYVIKNVYRYDKKNRGKVTYDELTDFCVEQHFGQMAIQRLHLKKGNYSRWDKRQMNKQQFAITLNYALKPIDIQAPSSIIDLLFSEIDFQRSGWISYQIYFMFLKFYFGSQNLALKKGPEVDEWDLLLQNLKGLNPLDYFVRLIVDQLRKIFLMYDVNKNLVFESDEIQNILKSIFQLNQTQAGYIIYNSFRFQARKNKFATFEELVAIILEVFFINIVIARKYKNQTSGLRFNLQNFIDLIRDNTFFLKFRPDNNLLTQVFQFIDTNRDNWITLIEYMNFIQQQLGRGLAVVEQPPIKNQPIPQSVPGVSSQQFEFIGLIWNELKAYFDKYDTGLKGYLNEAEVYDFVTEVLLETSQKQLDYVFWNYFRIDPDGNQKVQFEQFAPFILSHAAEIALQRFHLEQIKGKRSLTVDELFIVFKNAFNFLSSMPKRKNVIQLIFKRISKGKEATYSQYLGWINAALKKRFR